VRCLVGGVAMKQVRKRRIGIGIGIEIEIGIETGIEVGIEGLDGGGGVMTRSGRKGKGGGGVNIEWG
jgi:hypothetical protein